MSLMFSVLKSQGQKYIGAFGAFLFLSIIVSVLAVISTVITGELSQVALDGNISELIRFLLVITAVMLIRAFASALSALLLGRFGARAGYTFRKNFAKFFLQKPFSAFMDKKSGESMSIFANDLPQTTDLVALQGPRMFADILTLIITVVYMLTVNWWLTLIFFATFPVLIVMQVLIAKPIQKKAEKRLEATANFNEKANDSFQNASVVMAFSLENIMEKRVGVALDGVIVAYKNYMKSFLSLILAGIFFSLAPTLIITVILAQQVIGEHMLFSEFIVFWGLSSGASGWLQMLSQRQNNVKASEAGAKRFSEHIDGEIENAETGKDLILSSDIAVSANNLSFSYFNSSDSEENAVLALDGATFEIKKGSRVAFVGSSGSGKSTILKLALKLYEPTSGELNIMGVKSSEVSLNSLRSVVSYVPQDSFLFPETIAANITGEEDLKDIKKLEKAAADAGILEFIKSHPDNWNAVLSESAENISGGQKQRLALARAFYKNAEIILFDEATSALDSITESEILKSFENLSKDKTLVMVAHRLKAIRFCDEIIVMENGRIAGIGSHDELIRTNEVYKNLYQSQESEAM